MTNGIRSGLPALRALEVRAEPGAAERLGGEPLKLDPKSVGPDRSGIKATLSPEAQALTARRVEAPEPMERVERLKEQIDRASGVNAYIQNLRTLSSGGDSSGVKVELRMLGAPQK